jgi:hypothetical protein
MAYYADSFSPTLRLLKNGIDVGPVQADFVVWEDNGRTEFKYTSSLGSAGCNQIPFLWNNAVYFNKTDPFNGWQPSVF